MYELIKLNGVSEKQIAFAELLRQKYINNNKNRFEHILAKFAEYDALEKSKVLINQVKIKYAKNLDYKLYACIYNNNASEIIDIIKYDKEY